MQEAMRQADKSLFWLLYGPYIFWGITLLVWIWSVWMFSRYAEEHANEMQKIRILLEYHNERESKARSERKPTPDDARYRPPGAS